MDEQQCEYSWFTTGQCKNPAIPGFDRCLDHVSKLELLNEIIALRRVIALKKARVDHG